MQLQIRHDRDMVRIRVIMGVLQAAGQETRKGKKQIRVSRPLKQYLRKEWVQAVTHVEVVL